MFSVLSSVVCLSLLPVSHIPKKRYQSVQLPKLEMTIHLKINTHATPQKIWASHKWLCSFLCTSEYQIPKNKGIHQNFQKKKIFQRGCYPWLQPKSGSLPVKNEWIKCGKWIHHISCSPFFAHLTSFATPSRLADASIGNNFSTNDFEQNLSKVIFSPAYWFLLHGVI